MGGYGALTQDPVRKAALKAKNDEIESQKEHFIAAAPGREPTKWTERFRLEVDMMALHHGMRMVLWDDSVNNRGFWLWVKWDWATNTPAICPDDNRTGEPGWYQKLKRVFKPKGRLLDTSVPEPKLAAWIDTHTMAVHRFLDKLDLLERHPDSTDWPTEKGDHVDITSGAWHGALGTVPPMWVLDDPYGQQIKATEYPITA